MCAGSVGKPVAKVFNGGKRVAVAGLHADGQSLAADFHDDADAINLRLHRVGLRGDTLVRSGKHSLGQRGLGFLARANAKGRLAFNHVENERVQVGVRVGGCAHVVRDRQGMPGHRSAVKGESAPCLGCPRRWGWGLGRLSTPPEPDTHRHGHAKASK